MIIVSSHAVSRYRQRHLEEKDGRQTIELVREIEGLIEEGISANQIFDSKPKAFRLWGERRGKLPANERFVQCGERMGFILREDANGDRIVTTTFFRLRAKAA